MAVNIATAGLIPTTKDKSAYGYVISTQLDVPVGGSTKGDALSALHAGEHVVTAPVNDIGDVVVRARPGAAVHIGRAANDSASSSSSLEYFGATVLIDAGARSKLRATILHGDLGVVLSVGDWDSHDGKGDESSCEEGKELHDGG